MSSFATDNVTASAGAQTNDLSIAILTLYQLACLHEDPRKTPYEFQ